MFGLGTGLVTGDGNVGILPNGTKLMGVLVKTKFGMTAGDATTGICGDTFACVTRLGADVSRVVFDVLKFEERDGVLSGVKFGMAELSLVAVGSFMAGGILGKSATLGRGSTVLLVPDGNVLDVGVSAGLECTAGTTEGGSEGIGTLESKVKGSIDGVGAPPGTIFGLSGVGLTPSQTSLPEGNEVGGNKPLLFTDCEG